MEAHAGTSVTKRVLQKIVRNDAMKNDPPEIYGWRVFMLACSVSDGAIRMRNTFIDMGRLASVPCASAGTLVSSGALLSCRE